MKISASMACLPGLPLPFVGGVALAVQIVGVTEYWIGTPRQCALMLAARIPLAHFSVSSAMSLAKSAGEPGSTVPPRLASCALSLGSAWPALISLLSLSIICDGVF